jgi:hypothetical protein
MLEEWTRLASLLDEGVHDEAIQDKISCRFDPSGEYTVSSAYLLQFEGSVASPVAPLIWTGWAPGKCRFFLWTTEKKPNTDGRRLAAKGMGE